MLKRGFRWMVTIAGASVFFLAACFSGATKNAARRAEALRAEFPPGSSVATFLQRAKANECGEVAIAAPKSDRVDTMELRNASAEQLATFERRLSELPEGLVQGIVPGLPPFERFVVNVSFKDGRVTESGVVHVQ